MSDPWPLRRDHETIAEVQRQFGGDLARRLANVDLMVMDCDGVMTDRALYFGPDGEALKAFDAADGVGLMMLRMAGVRRAVLTGRQSAMVLRRCQELKFEHVVMGRFDKRAALAQIIDAAGGRPETTLYMGDDLLDLPALADAGVTVTVPDAVAEVREVCDLVTRAFGGRGAVREVCDLLLKSRGGFGDAIRALAEQGPPNRSAQPKDDA